MIIIKQINNSITYNFEQKQFIDTLKPFEGKYWKRLPDGNTKEIIKLKKDIRNQLINIQGTDCAYCGLALEETSDIEIEHIAPKGRGKYPQFMFVELNMVLACRLCNGFKKKGAKDTISKYEPEYKNCEFLIVHPYFDNPDDHYSWTSNTKQILIQSKSEKGKKSIEIFKLTDEAQISGRTKKVMFELLNLPPNALELYIQISTYKNK